MIERYTAKTILAGMGAAFSLLGGLDADTDAHLTAAVNHLSAVVLTHLSEAQMDELTGEILADLLASMAAENRSLN